MKQKIPNPRQFRWLFPIDARFELLSWHRLDTQGHNVSDWASANLTACVPLCEAALNFETDNRNRVSERALSKQALFRDMPLTIAIDVDEVLGAFVAPLCDFHNETYGTSLKQSDFFSYRFCEVWGGTDEEATEKIHTFFDSSHFKNLPPVRGATEAVPRLKHMGHKLVVVTSRQLSIQDETRSWLHRHFAADAFKDVVFGNHWGLKGRKIKKIDLCREVGADVLIDDSLSYAREIAANGKKSLLFDLDGEYGWNNSEELPAGITRVHNWEQVVQKFQE